MVNPVVYNVGQRNKHKVFRKSKLVEGKPVNYLNNAAEELNLGQPRTNLVSSREEETKLGLLDFKSNTPTTASHAASSSMNKETASRTGKYLAGQAAIALNFNYKYTSCEGDCCKFPLVYKPKSKEKKNQCNYDLLFNLIRTKLKILMVVTDTCTNLEKI